MKKKVTFATEKRSRLEDYAKQEDMNLTEVINYIIDCHFENIERSDKAESIDSTALKRIEDKLDSLLLQDSKPKKTVKNKGKYQEIVKCIKDNAQDIGAVALIELMDIIPELKTK